MNSSSSLQTCISGWSGETQAICHLHAFAQTVPSAWEALHLPSLLWKTFAIHCHCHLLKMLSSDTKPMRPPQPLCGLLSGSLVTALGPRHLPATADLEGGSRARTPESISTNVCRTELFLWLFSGWITSILPKAGSRTSPWTLLSPLPPAHPQVLIILATQSVLTGVRAHGTDPSLQPLPSQS